MRSSAFGHLVFNAEPHVGEGNAVELDRALHPVQTLRRVGIVWVVVHDIPGDKVIQVGAARELAEVGHLTRPTGHDLVATGNRVTISGITIDCFEDGKIVEAWRSMDMLSVRRGIGVLDAR